MAMRPSVWITHGTTESGDAVPLVAWPQEPDGEAIIAHYKELIPDEFDAFGDEFVGNLIECDEVRDWGA